MNNIMLGLCPVGTTTGTEVQLPPEGGPAPTTTTTQIRSTNDAPSKVTERMSVNGDLAPDRCEIPLAADNGAVNSCKSSSNDNAFASKTEQAVAPRDVRRKRPRENAKASPSERTLRPRRPQTAPDPHTPADATKLRVYALGIVPQADRDDWLAMIACFHQDPMVQDLVVQVNTMLNTSWS